MSMMSSGGGLNNGRLALATAQENEVLAGETFYSGSKEIKTGAMPNHGAWGTTINAGGSVTIPQGYHNGGGKVSSTKKPIGCIVCQSGDGVGAAYLFEKDGSFSWNRGSYPRYDTSLFILEANTQNGFYLTPKVNLRVISDIRIQPYTIWNHGSLGYSNGSILYSGNRYGIGNFASGINGGSLNILTFEQS